MTRPWPIIALLFTGCANLNLHPDTGQAAPPPSTVEEAIIPPKANQHLSEISTISNFKLSGRIGIQMSGYGLSGPIQWEHSQQIDDIDLYSPFGSKVAQINKTQDGVTLTDKDGKIYKAQDTESLTQSTLGWRIPFSNLSDWVLGRPAKGLASNLNWDDTGKITQLTQDGWEISYMEYQAQNHYALPSKINLRNAKMNVRLIIENWELTQTIAVQNAP